MKIMQELRQALSEVNTFIFRAEPNDSELFG